MATAEAVTGELEDAPPWPAKARAKPLASLVSDDDCLPDIARLSVPEAPRPLPALEGFPDPEQAPDVIAGRANYQRLADELRAASRERAALEAELGLPTNATPGQVERVATKLLVDGGTDEQVQRLVLLAQRERRLRGACELAARRVHELTEESRRKLKGEAVAKLVGPKRKAVAPAVLNLLIAIQGEQREKDRLAASGFGSVDGLFYQIDTSVSGQNVTVNDLVRLGLLDREDVRLALPYLQGI